MKKLKIICLLLFMIIIIGAYYSYNYIALPSKKIIELQEKKLSKSVNTIVRAKLKIEELIDDVKKREDWLLKSNDILISKNKKLKSCLIDREVKNSIVSIEQEKECPKTIEMWSFQENINLQTADIAYNKWLWGWYPYVVWANLPNISEVYNKTKKVLLKSNIKAYCWVEYYKKWIYSKNEKKIMISYVRSFCKDQKNENCSDEIKEMMKKFKWDWVSESNWVQLITKYKDWNPNNYTERLLAYYDNFWKKICIIRENLKNWKSRYSSL